VSVPTPAGAVVLRARDRWPAAALVRDDGDVCLVTAGGFAASPRGTLLQADGYVGLLALDGQDLLDSQALLVAPFEPGSIRLPDRDGSWVVVAGESVGGRWTSYAVTPLSQEDPRLTVDEDLASLLLLVCRPAERPRWEEHLTTMFTQPHRVPGL
jgi:hypothetical protein